MNTINFNSVRTYSNLRDNNIPAETPQPVSSPAVSFKGAIGDTLIKEAGNSAPPLNTIMSKVKGTFGLSAEKAKDVFESLLTKITTMSNELVAKNSEIQSLKGLVESLKTELSREENVNIQLHDSIKTIVADKNGKISELNSKIEELKKYEGLGKVKSVEELDTVMPEQVLSILEEAKAHHEEAHKSLGEFLFTGKGQEAFLEQMERSNTILKAKQDKMDAVPKVGKALEDSRSELTIGYEPAYVAAEMMENILKFDERGEYLNSPVMFNQVKNNAEAIILPMHTARSQYAPANIDKALKEVVDFHNNLVKGMNHLQESGFVYKGETRKGISLGQSYRTFVDKDGTTRDFPLTSIAYGNFGLARIKSPDGKIIQDWSGIKE